MAENNASVEQVIGLHAQMNQIMKMVGHGSLNPVTVKRALQLIVEGKFDQASLEWQPPRWWRSPREQIARVRNLWGHHLMFPDPPVEFVPQTPTEILLLHVPRPFDVLWDAVDTPSSYGKYQYGSPRTPSQQHMRVAGGIPLRDRPVWLAFDPAAHRGEVVENLWGLPNLAASEVLSALIQFPNWPTTWVTDNQDPYLAGYQCQSHEGTWSCVPYLSLEPNPHRLALSVRSASARDELRVSPTVRVLS